MEKRKRSRILDTAKQTICHDRQDQYGNPEDNFQTIADYWQTYLSQRCVGPGVSVDLGPDDVANLMVLLKMARICTGTVKEDNYVDLIGYAALGAEMATAEPLYTVESTYLGKAPHEVIVEK